MSRRDLRLLFEDVLDCANRILKYTDGLTYDEFISDNKAIDATVRDFEIIGEATNRIPADFKIKHPEID